jgi:hypothetical protein
MFNRRSTRLVAGAAVLVLAAGLNVSPAQADVPNGSFSPTTSNASDPYITQCYIGGTLNLCLYTSQDMSSGNYANNTYPMSVTNLYTLASGLNPGVQSNWVSRGAVLSENAYSWVPTAPGGGAANHLWAPTMYPGGDGNYYLYVPDVTDTSATGLSTSSQIGVSVSANPNGPFSYLKRITYNGNNLTGYMSDPAVMQTMGGLTDIPEASRWLAWADGDFNTCGGISVARLDDADLTSLRTAPTPVSFIVGGANTLPNGLNSCTKQGGFTGSVNHAYMEGPELYFMPITGVGPFAATYMLTFAIKPNNVNAPGCSSQNEALAYATSEDPRGPYTYRGIIMCGASTQWTNQGSLYAYSYVDANFNYSVRFMLFYHDAVGSAVPQNRKTHAECLTVASTGITAVTRSTTFSGCMPSTSAWTNTIVIH